MVSIAFAVTLMVTMALKHFVADFLLQTAGIAKGKAADRGWFVHLGVHAGCHAAGTLAVALVVAPATWWLTPAESRCTPGSIGARCCLAAASASAL